MSVEFEKPVMGNLPFLMKREWIVTNGLSGYSSSTLSEINTRKYHGLLIAPVKPPWHRKLFLSKLEEEIFIQGKKFQLSANCYPGAIYPQGYRYLQRFSLNPFPTFEYEFQGIKIKKLIFMPHRINAVSIRYTITNYSKELAKVLIHPLVNSRGIHEVLRRQALDWSFKQKAGNKNVKLRTPNGDILLGSDAMVYHESELSEEERWHKNMEYPEERERGYDYLEDHYCPGFFEAEMGPGTQCFNLFATAGFGAENAFRELFRDGIEKKLNEEKKRLKCLEGPFKVAMGCLVRAADSFVVGDREKKSIIAGYHWFSTWGRDTLIALPGLAMVTGRYGLAKSILSTFVERIRDGLLPNRFGNGWAEYNSIDTSLWFFYSLYKYFEYTSDMRTLQKFWPILNQILERYARGTESMRVGEDGLLYGGEGLTWMDARVDGKPITPRKGNAVEVNALWYNSLKIMEFFSQALDEEFRYRELVKKIENNFIKIFWNEKRGCLFDCVDGSFRDPAIRPNQIFALSLPFQLLDGEKAEEVLSVVTRELLTPVGLRSLERGDPRYKGKCAGNQGERDSAYHQGTVWSWLIGPFVTAFIKVTGNREKAWKFVEPLLKKHLNETGLGTISEIFDGDEPHEPRGCISQAWSVGEILRCWREDIKGEKLEKNLGLSTFGFP
jgi:predicted glycogen debranching enzyme